MGVTGAVSAGTCTTGTAIGPVSTTSSSGSLSGSTGGLAALTLASPTAAPPLNLANLPCPRRPDIGHEGRHITLRANHFQISMPRGFVHHYEVIIQPDKCPRKV